MSKFPFVETLQDPFISKKDVVELGKRIAVITNAIVMIWWSIYLSYRFLYFPKNDTRFLAVDIATILVCVISNVVVEKVCATHKVWKIVRLALFFWPIFPVLFRNIVG